MYKVKSLGITIAKILNFRRKFAKHRTIKIIIFQIVEKLNTFSLKTTYLVCFRKNIHIKAKYIFLNPRLKTILILSFT